MIFKNKKENKQICPFIKGPCLEHDCVFYVKVQGKHPQTGKDIDYWDCTFKIQSLLLMDHGRQLEGIRIVSEETRNQTAKTSENLLKAAYLFNKGVTLIDYRTGNRVEDLTIEYKNSDENRSEQ